MIKTVNVILILINVLKTTVDVGYKNKDHYIAKCNKLNRFNIGNHNVTVKFIKILSRRRFTGTIIVFTLQWSKEFGLLLTLSK